MTIQLIAVVVPLASSYEAVWVGLGAVALDVLVVVILTSLVRGRMPVAAWRVIHWMSYAAYPVMMLHSVFSAQDMQSGVFLGVAVVCTVAMALAVAYRCGCALAGVSQWQRVAVLLDGGRDRSAYRPRPRGGRRR